jgi:GDP-L-fucose synthase
MPTNLYGPGDNFHPTSSHVIPGMMRRFHEAKVSGAKSVTIWGTGKPLREFMHVDDLARALQFLIRTTQHDGKLINVGSNQELSILELAYLMKDIVGFKGEVLTDPSKPDGTPRKRLDSSRLEKLGFKPAISLKEGLASTYLWALENRVFDVKPKARQEFNQPEASH